LISTNSELDPLDAGDCVGPHAQLVPVKDCHASKSTPINITWLVGELEPVGITATGIIG